MHRVLAVIVVVLLVRTLPAQVVRLSPDEFSADVVSVDLFLALDGTEGRVGSSLEGLGIVFESGNAVNQGCVGDAVVVAGQDRPGFTNEAAFHFVDPATGEPAVTQAFGTYIGSLDSTSLLGLPLGRISEVTLSAYDIDGTLIGTVSTSPTSPHRNSTGPTGDFLGVQFAGGIHRIVLSNGASTDVFAMGDFHVTVDFPTCPGGDVDFLFEPPFSQMLSLRYSLSPSRSSPMFLDGARVTGEIFPFLAPEVPMETITRVHFWIDDPKRIGSPARTDEDPPYDAAGGDAGAAPGLDTTGLSDGAHTLTALIEIEGSADVVLRARFTVGDDPLPIPLKPRLRAIPAQYPEAVPMMLPPRARPQVPSMHASIRFSRWEFDEVTFDIIDDLGTKFGEVDFEDVERKRVEVRIGGGLPEITGFVSLFGEEFLEDADGDFVGFGLGVQGTVNIVELSADASFFLEYEASGSVNIGEGEAEVLLLPSLVIVEVDEDLEYVEGIFRIGLGIQCPFGLRLSAGIVTSVIDGEYDIDGFAETGDFEASNTGGYFSARFEVPDAPVYIQAEVIVGDIEGFMISGGLQF